jgi:hypothetical protein
MGYSAILCVLAPNLVMLGLFLDQALYPPLFLLMATGILLAVRKKFALACFLMGAAVYVALFLSFSLLPLLVIPLFYFACIAWQDHRWSALWENFKSTLLPMGLGGLLSMALFKVFLNYDIFTRYQHMMATRIEGDFYTRFGLQSTGNVSILVKIQQAWDAAKLNNIELAVAIGFPVFIFFVVVGVRSLIHVLRRETDPAAAINSSLFLAYVALNSMRVVLGEVARLWMFWIPVMALLAVQFLLPFMRRNRWLIFALVAMQFVTLFLSYQYQDYFMPQLLP